MLAGCFWKFLRLLASISTTHAKQLMLCGKYSHLPRASRKKCKDYARATHTASSSAWHIHSGESLEGSWWLEQKVRMHGLRQEKPPLEGKLRHYTYDSQESNSCNEILLRVLRLRKGRSSHANNCVDCTLAEALLLNQGQPKQVWFLIDK